MNHAPGIERDHYPKSNGSTNAMAALFAIAATTLGIFSIYLTCLLQWDGAFRDLWEFIDDIEQQFHGHWDAAYLLDAYGGAHRIFLPKLLFFLDYRLLGGRNFLTIATALLSQLTYLWLVVKTLRQQTSLTAAEQTILGASFAIALFSVSQVSNFLYAMDVQWHMSNLLGLTCLFLLAAPATERHWLFILLAGIAAALCNFTGLMALPVAALVLLLEKPSRQSQWSTLALILVFCLWYVHHEHNEQQFVLQALDKSDSLQLMAYIVIDTLGKMIPYMLRYLASPLSREWPLAGSTVSAAGLFFIAFCWLQHYQQKLSRWQRLCLYIATYIAASAFFTAFGRIIYPNSATHERYQTLVLPWLPALCGLLWPQLRTRIAPHILAATWATLLGWYLLPTQATSTAEMSALSYRVQLAHTAARAGVLEHPYISASLSHPLLRQGINAVKDNDAFLRSQQLGYFQHLPNYALDTQPVIDPALPTCSGNTAAQYDADTSIWVIDGQLLAGHQPTSDVVLLQGGKVVGLGLLLRPVESLLPARWQEPGQSRFRAFATGSHLNPSSPATLLGLEHGQPVCLLVIPGL